jgi:TfuA protein
MLGVHSKIRVLAGPSRPANFVSPQIDWAPPAGAGDLREAEREGFRVLVLADTLFFDAPPSHREILDVIEGGVEVVGCASAGALRAAELESHGMIGAGLVFELYRDGSLADDAEIACVLDATYRAVAPPLLELRFILGRLTVETGDKRALQSAFREIANLYFLRRDRASLLRIAAERLNAATCLLFEQYLDDPIHKLKARDLERVAMAVANSKEISLGVEPLPPDQRNWLACGLGF